MSVLKKIFETKAKEVGEAKSRVSLAELKNQAADSESTRGFLKALQTSTSGLALIAEVKKASPSKGIIRPNFDPAEIAKAYEDSGASALSVLTDVGYFQGSPDNIKIARRTVGLPILRKDFINDPYQVYEARAWGADAILLIVAALEDRELLDLHGLANELSLDVLVEVHTEEETERALNLGFPLIGVNNRDLGDFHTAIETSERLIPKIAPHALAVSESALETALDLDRVQTAGAKAVLIGTSFCAAPDIRTKVAEVGGGRWRPTLQSA